MQKSTDKINPGCDRVWAVCQAADYIPLRLATDLDFVMNDAGVVLVLPPGLVLDPRLNELAWANDRIPTLFSLRQENSGRVCSAYGGWL